MKVNNYNGNRGGNSCVSVITLLHSCVIVKISFKKGENKVTMRPQMFVHNKILNYH